MYRIIFITIYSLFIFTYCNSQERNPVRIKNQPVNSIIDSLVVLKSERTLTVFSKSKKIKTYQIALGKNAIGKKEFEGDFKTPEGLYYIDTKSAASKFHKNLNVSYPNKSDVKYAAAQNKRAGGDIKIHGLPNGFNETKYERSDWTWGCIGLTNSEIDELFEFIKMGSSILILP